MEESSNSTSEVGDTKGLVLGPSSVRHNFKPSVEFESKSEPHSETSVSTHFTVIVIMMQKDVICVTNQT